MMQGCIDGTLDIKVGSGWKRQRISYNNGTGLLTLNGGVRYAVHTTEDLPNRMLKKKHRFNFKVRADGQSDSIIEAAADTAQEKAKWVGLNQLAPDNMLSVFLMDSSQCDIPFGPSSTIRSLKQLLTKEMGHEADTQRWIFDGAELHDDTSAAQCCLVDGSIVICILQTKEQPLLKPPSSGVVERTQVIVNVFVR